MHLFLLHQFVTFLLFFIFSDYGLQGDPNCEILRYWARIEAAYCKNMERFRLLWNDILSQGHDTTAAMWLEYIQWERFVKIDCDSLLDKILEILLSLVYQAEFWKSFELHVHLHINESGPNRVCTHVGSVTLLQLVWSWSYRHPVHPFIFGCLVRVVRDCILFGFSGYKINKTKWTVSIYFSCGITNENQECCCWKYLWNYQFLWWLW